MVQETAAAATAISAQQIAARIERLPVSRWHTKMRLIIGTAWFFDGFDALTIAFVLPALIPMWKLGPEQIGLLIAAGYAGQAIGSVAAGWAAERYGRTRVMLWMLVIFTLGSFSCAAAWSLGSMMVLRFIQGLGLGGEIPIMHAYVDLMDFTGLSFMSALRSVAELRARCEPGRGRGGLGIGWGSRVC